MQVVIFDHSEQVAQHAAQWISDLITNKTTPVLGLATGSTPISLYNMLVDMHQTQALSFADVTTFNLDEYHNIAPDNPQSYCRFMHDNLFSLVDIDPANTHLPTCSANQNPRQQGLKYEAAIEAAGGIDLQILGIGANGHIGFNEPSSSLASKTRIKTLTEQTIQDNSRLFKSDEHQPDSAMTMGIGTIMASRYVLLMATGEHKAAAVNAMITGPLSATCPASALQMHENAIVVLDKAAASKLTNQSYYRWADRQNAKLNAQYGFYHNY